MQVSVSCWGFVACAKGDATSVAFAMFWVLPIVQPYGPEQGIKLLGLLLTGSTGKHMASRNGLA